MRHFIILLSLFLSFDDLFGQNVMTGSVKSDGKPVQFASILVYKFVDSDTLVTAFSTTNSQGSYSVQIPKIQTVYRVCASSMGFETKCIDTTFSQSLTYNFELKAKVFELSEVEVKGIVPIKIKKDTVVYKAEAFRDGTERNIEDLLKKLPGIKVNDKGDISFKGRAIEKLMIEGEDFFSKGYKLITKNVDADIIDKIEAIDNFIENPLLKNIEKSDKVALNITVDSKKKHLRLFGNAEFSLANTGQFRIKTNGFTLRKKLKIGLISTNNTLGENPIPDAEYYLGTSSENDRVDNTPLLLDSFKENINGLEEKRYLQNNTNLIALNINYSPSEKFKVKQIFYLFKDKNTMFTQNFSSFTNANIPFNVSEKQSIQRSPLGITGILKVDYMINSKSLIQMTCRANNQNLDANALISSMVVNTKDSINNNGSEEGKLLSFETNFTHKLNKNTAFLAKANYSWNLQQEQLLMNSKRFAPLFSLDTTLAWINQIYFRKLYIFNLETKIVGVRKGFYYQGGISFQYQDSNDLTKILFSQAKQGNYESINQNLNDNLFSMSQWVGDWSVSKKFEKIRFWLGSKNNLVRGSVTRLQDNNNEQSLFFVNPDIGIAFNFDDNNQIRLSYKNSRASLSSQYLLTRGFFTNYRSIEEGYRNINFANQSNFYGITFSKHDWYNQFSLVSQFLYNAESNVTLRSFDLSNTLITKYKKNVSDKTNNNFQFHLQTDKFFSSLKANAKINFDAYVSTFYNSLSEKSYNKNNLFTYNYALTVGTSFKGVANFLIDFSSIYTRVSPENTSRTFDNQYTKSSLTFFLNFSKSFSSKIINEVNFWKGGSGNGNTYFLDIDATYKLPNSKFTLQLEGRNLLNNTQIDIVSSNDITFQQSTFKLLKPYLLLGLHFSF